jgi:hypothetical protein
MSVRVKLVNNSHEPLRVGGVAISQERLLRKSKDGKLEVVGTTEAPDDLWSPDEPRVKRNSNVSVSTGQSKTAVVDHYVYLSASALAQEEEAWVSYMSFHVSNILDEGTVHDYWSEPVRIQLPGTCQLADLK